MYGGVHNPKLSKALVALFLGLAFMLSGSLRFVPNWYTVFAIAIGVIASGLGVVEAKLLLNNSAMDKQEMDRRLIEALSKTDAETRQLLGLKMPHYNYRWDGQKTYTAWQDTFVPVDIFWKFLRESNDKNTVAQRTWKDHGLHNEWIAIYETLVEFGLVIEQSHTGPYSEFWAGDGWQRAHDYWPRRIKEME